MRCRDKKTTRKTVQILPLILALSFILYALALACPPLASGNEHLIHTVNRTDTMSEDPAVEQYDTENLLPDLYVERISIPAANYVAEKNLIIITVKNGGWNVSGNFNISLAANENQTKNGSSSPYICNVTVSPILKNEKRIVYATLNFTKLSHNASFLLTIDPEGMIPEQNKGNNRVGFTISTHQKLCPCYYELNNAIDSALAYLEKEKDEEGKINDFSTTCFALPALSLCEIPDHDLIVYLKNNSTHVLNSTDVTAWALTTLAITSLGENPKNFSTINFIGILESFFDGEQFGSESRLDDDCFALLALSSAGEVETELIRHVIENLLKQQRKDDGWCLYGQDTSSSSVADTALCVQALLSTELVSSENASVKKALEFITNNQNDDGSFSYTKEGKQGMTIPTALALSALAASHQSEYDDSIQNATEYLLEIQAEEGYFPDYNYIKSTSYAIIALSCQYLPPFHQLVFDESLPDVYPTEFAVQPKGANENLTDIAYAHVTNVVRAWIKNTGGAFNVSLIENGSVLDEKRVVEQRSNAETEVLFQWNPSSVGRYNLSLRADIRDEIAEINEENNILSKELEVVLPDLSPDLQLIQTIYSNFTNEVPVKIKGFGEHFNVSFSTTFLDNGSDNLTYNRMILTCYEETIINHTWKPNCKGNYSVSVTIDPDDDVEESNEENNIVEREVSVIEPDLLPCAISFIPPGNASFRNKFLLVNKSNMLNVSVKGAGENVNVSVYVYRIKANETRVANVTNLSTIMNDTSEILIEKRTIARILWLKNVSFLWFPRERGFYRVIAEVDVDHTVTEENESNNVLYADIEVITGAPDIQLISPRGGETFINSEYITVQWNATDPDGDLLTITVRYKPDYGNGWINLVETVEQPIGTYSWHVEDLPDGDYVVMVEADDGNFTDSDMAIEPFTLSSKESHVVASQFHYNAGFSLSEAPDTNAIAWNTTDIGAVASSQPIVAGGKVFVYCDNERGSFITALDEDTGELMWKREVEKRSAYGSWSSPGYHDEAVFIGSGKKVYSLNAENGAVNWAQGVTRDIVNSCPTIASGMIFIGGYGARGNPEYYCLDEETGSTVWTFNEAKASDIAGGRATSTPAWYNRAVCVGIGTWGSGGALYCLNCDNGTEIWNITTDYGVWGSITPIHGILYFGTYNFDGDATYYALHPADGTVKWKKTGIRTDSTPAYAFGNLYISSGCVGYSKIVTHCLDPENGNELWTVENIGGWTVSPVVSRDGKLIVGKIGRGGDTFAAGGTYCLDASTGEEIWSSSHGGSTAVIVNGRVYTIGEGRVWCFGSLHAPDLNISSLETPERVYVGETVNVNVTVKNVGESAANRSFTVLLRANGVEIGSSTIRYLSQSEEKSVTFRWTPDESDVGACRIVAEVDPEDTIAEKNPLNNKAFSDVEAVAQKPDITPFGMTTAGKLYAGSETCITVTVKNVGGKKADNVLVTLTIKGNKLGSKTIATINPDETRSAEFIWAPTTYGTFTLTAEVDPEGLLEEMNEENNVISKDIIVYMKEEDVEPKGGIGGSSHRKSVVDQVRKAPETGTTETGTGAERGGVHQPMNESKCTPETTNEVVGHPFGTVPSGELSSGGTLPVTVIVLILLIIGLFYFGYYKEKKMYRRR
jgi:outer membrane protein assembly factor BamB/subtilase family serine protease